MDHAQGDISLQFESEEIDISGRTATQYTADMAASVGVTDLPEVHKAMEVLYGEEGKLRFQLVIVNETTVLAANASIRQTGHATISGSARKFPGPTRST